jgi:SAM-dependent methyltransferase
VKENLSSRHDDGSAGDANYGSIGARYTEYRRPDPRIAALIHRTLGESQTVLNVGAGAGSYEPTDRPVTAVEPSASMRAQRPPHLPPAVDASAECLPFEDGSFDAGMATFTVHQWRDLQAGLREMRRAVRNNIVILTCDPGELDRFWLRSYAPEVILVEARRYPRIEVIAEVLGPGTEIIPVPIPLDCTDGFGEAYYGRPEGLLNPAARLACSAWSFVGPAATCRFEAALARDLERGAWDLKHGHLRTQSYFDGSLKMIVGRR